MQPQLPPDVQLFSHQRLTLKTVLKQPKPLATLIRRTSALARSKINCKKSIQDPQYIGTAAFTKRQRSYPIESRANIFFYPKFNFSGKY